MKKALKGFFYIGIAAAIIYFLSPKIFQLFFDDFSFKGDSTQLNSVNAALQISYNLIYLLLAMIVAFVAYDQLSKSRQATTVQTLIDIDEKMRSDGFIAKRKRLAEFVIKNGVENLALFLKRIESKHELTTDEINTVASIKNILEDIIYQFELIGYFYARKIYDIEDIYQLFSVELQHYWVLMEEIGFIEYLRYNQYNPNEDFYDKFEMLFNDTLKQEVINSKKFKFFWRFYYWWGIFRIFYCLQSSKRRNKIHYLIVQKKKAIPLFLTEERNLCD